MWYDTHAHVTDEAFRDDLPDVLSRAREAGVSRINVISCDWATSLETVEFARRHAFAQAVVGVHPQEADSYAEEIEERLEALLEDLEGNKIVAIGEIGLDYHYENSPRDRQKKVFRAQIALASRHGLPLVIHDRDAHEDTYEILAEARATGQLLPVDPGVLHCYSGSAEMARRFLDLGFLLGVDGPLTFKNARHPQEVVARVPHDRLVVETDSPYLSPTPYRGKRNEPSRVPLVGAKVAEIWGVPVEEVARVTTENALRLFRNRR